VLGSVGLLVLLASGPAELPPVPADTVRVFLVRHGQAFTNLEPPPARPPDQLDRLTELGRAQSRAAAAALRGSRVAAVLSSPAGRARGTAEEMRAALGVAGVRVERGVRPLELGRGTDGKPLTWDQRIAEWTAGRDPAPAGGESLAQLGDRVEAVVRRLAPRYAGRSVVIVAHSEVIGAFAGGVEGLPGHRRHPPGIANGSLSAVEVRADGRLALLFRNHLPRP
jgi:probable phosphoglycerate mutase